MCLPTNYSSICCAWIISTMLLPRRGTRALPAASPTRLMMKTLRTLYVELALLLVLTAACDTVYVTSSFWAPLFNPRILNFRVDSTFDPNAGRNYRVLYIKSYGVRGERLIADLGNGKGPGDVPLDKNIGTVDFYYTYPGADGDNSVN